MIEVSVDDLKQAVEGLHGCHATFREVLPVTETFEGRTVWEGLVHVFDLQGCPSATTAFAWSSPIEGSDRRRFYAVLAVPPITTPNEAIRASIIVESLNFQDS